MLVTENRGGMGWGSGVARSFPHSSEILPQNPRCLVSSPAADLVLGKPGPHLDDPWVFPHCYKKPHLRNEVSFCPAGFSPALKPACFYFFHFSQCWQKMLFSFASYLKTFILSLFPLHSFLPRNFLSSAIPQCLLQGKKANFPL